MLDPCTNYGWSVTANTQRSDSDGTQSWDVKSTVPGLLTLGVSADGVTLADTITLYFDPLENAVDPDASSVARARHAVAADGKEEILYTVKVLNSEGKLLSGKSVKFVLHVPNDYNDYNDCQIGTVVPSEAVSDDDGMAQFKVSSTYVGKFRVCASADGIWLSDQPAASFKPCVDPSTSAIYSKHTQTVPANGNAEAKIKLYLRDAKSFFVAHKRVSLLMIGLAEPSYWLKDVEMDWSICTDQEGKAEFTLKSKHPLTVKFKVLCENQILANDITVNFVE